MPFKFDFECLYCGHKEVKEIYYKPSEASCSKCGDKKLKIKEIEKGDKDIYGYSYSPEFPEKKKKIPDWID